MPSRPIDPRGADLTTQAIMNILRQGGDQAQQLFEEALPHLTHLELAQVVTLLQAEAETVRNSRMEDQKLLATLRTSLDEIAKLVEEGVGEWVTTRSIERRDDEGLPCRITVYGGGGSSVWSRGVLPTLPAQQRHRITPGTDVLVNRETGFVIAVTADPVFPGRPVVLRQVLDDDSLWMRGTGQDEGQIFERGPALRDKKLEPGMVLRVVAGMATAILEEASPTRDFPGVIIDRDECNAFIGASILDQIETEILLPLMHLDSYARFTTGLKVRPTRSLMLFGPPGTGKTTLARTIGARLARCGGLRCVFIPYRPDWSSFYGESARNIDRLQNGIDAHLSDGKTLVVLFIDDVDLVASSRSGNTYRCDEDQKVLGRWLSLLEGFTRLPAGRFLAISASNRHVDLDDALASRLGERQVEVPLMGEMACQAMLEKLLGAVPVFSPGRQSQTRARQALLQRALDLLMSTEPDNCLYRLVYRGKERAHAYLGRRHLSLTGRFLEHLATEAAVRAFVRATRKDGPEGLLVEDLETAVREMDHRFVTAIRPHPVALKNSTYMTRAVDDQFDLDDVVQVVPLPQPVRPGAVLRVAS